MDRFDGQVMIVTGAARGLGAAFVDRLTAEGASVVAADIRPEVVEVAANQSATVVPVVADVSKVVDVERLVGEAFTRFGRIDVLVNNAGISAITDPGASLRDSLIVYDQLFAVNTRGAWLCGRAVIPTMIDQGSGHIVNVSTDHVLEPPHKPPKTSRWMDAYDATKWALEGFTRVWAGSLADRGIRVNALSMGETDTPMLRNHVVDRTGSPVPEEVAARWIEPAAVAGVLADLLAEGAGGRTGTNVGLWPELPLVLPPVPRSDPAA